MSRISSDTRVGWLWEKAYVGIARSNLSVRERLRRCFVDCCPDDVPDERGGLREILNAHLRLLPLTENDFLL